MARPRAGKGERSLPNKAPGTHSSSRGRTKGVVGAAEATRPLPAPGGQSAATAVSAPAKASSEARPRDLARRSPRAPAHDTPRGHQVPPYPAAPPVTPSPMPQPPPAPNNGLSHGTRRGLGKGPGRRRRGPGRSSPRPPAHLPPTARPQPGGGAAATWKIGLTFPEPARPRAPPSLCLWQTWFAEKAPNLVAAAAATSPAAPELPPRSRSPPRRSLARALLAALPSLPPRRWLRALSSCQSVSPGRGPISLEVLPRRLGLGCRCRGRSPAGPAARWLARAPARPAPPAPPSAPPAPLPLPLPLVYLELNRTWLPGQGSEAGVNVPRLIAASANRRTGAVPGRPGGTPCQPPAEAVPSAAAFAEPVPLLLPASGGVRGCAPLPSVVVGRGHQSGWGSSGFPAPARRGFNLRSAAWSTGWRGEGAAAALEGRARGPLSGAATSLSLICPSPPPAAARACPALISPPPLACLSPWALTPAPSPDSSLVSPYPGCPAPGPRSCPVWLPSGPGAPRCERGNSSRRQDARLLLY